jgi:glutamate-1-semialdehyde aminotransferase
MRYTTTTKNSIKATGGTMTTHSMDEAIAILDALEHEVHNMADELRYVLRREDRRITDRTRESADYLLRRLLPGMERAAGALRALLQP